MAGPFNYDAQDVALQDQTTPVVIANFNEVHNSTTLSVVTAFGDYTITVADATGFVVGDYLIMFSPDDKRFYFGHVLNVAALVITLDTPIDFAFPVGAFVDATLDDMSVNGSVTPRVFGLRGLGVAPGVDLKVDITRVIFQCITTSAVDLSLFANLVALTNGLVLRHRDGAINTQNIFNVKTNAEIAGIMYDFTVYAQTNPVQGVDGFVSRLTFGSQGKIGVVVRLPVGEDLELIVQDDLSTLTSFKIVAEGHIVDEAAQTV